MSSEEVHEREKLAERQNRSKSEERVSSCIKEELALLTAHLEIHPSYRLCMYAKKLEEEEDIGVEIGE